MKLTQGSIEIAGHKVPLALLAVVVGALGLVIMMRASRSQASVGSSPSSGGIPPSTTDLSPVTDALSQLAQSDQGSLSQISSQLAGLQGTLAGITTTPGTQPVPSSPPATQPPPTLTNPFGAFVAESGSALGGNPGVPIFASPSSTAAPPIGWLAGGSTTELAGSPASGQYIHDQRGNSASWLPVPVAGGGIGWVWAGSGAYTGGTAELASPGVTYGTVGLVDQVQTSNIGVGGVAKPPTLPIFGKTGG